jgi:putative oxidoreductase
MKKFLSVKHNATSFNITFLLLRLVFGTTMMISSGYPKLIEFAVRKKNFVNFLGLGSTASLSLVIFAEVFCAAFIIIGLFTRFAAIPLCIAMGYACFVFNQADIMGDGRASFLFLIIFILLLVFGPGKYSIDGFISK